jgi:hypothetical protein
MYLLTCLDRPFLSFEAQISEIRKVWDHPNGRAAVFRRQNAARTCTVTVLLMKAENFRQKGTFGQDLNTLGRIYSQKGLKCWRVQDKI